ncbi:MAG: aspartate kinase [Limnochordia bacterium]|jgi:aspartate kinase
MAIIIQKFGGTAVATPEGRGACRRWVGRALDGGNQVVVVVSAMGRKGSPYATDTLIDLAGPVPPRELDLIMACGEIISGVVFQRELLAAGLEAVVLNGAQAGITTDGVYNGARIVNIDTTRIRRELEEGKVVIVAGFQGGTPEGEITTLGRGGSDTTAAALGVALGAEQVEIYTDVDGIMTADPRIVPEAHVLEELTYREIMEMAHLGAKVIHPRAVEIAMQGSIPIVVRSADGQGEGTLIKEWGAGVDITGDRVVTGIAHLAPLAQLVIRSRDGSNGQLEYQVFRRLGEAQISVDLIQVNPGLIAFTILDNQAKKAAQLLGDLPVDVEINRQLAKVSVVGGGMRGVPGVMARVVGALYHAGVTIYQTADSHANISCLIKAEEVASAVGALHKEFRL